MTPNGLRRLLVAAAAGLMVAGVVPLAAHADRPAAPVEHAVTRAAAGLAGKPKATIDVVVTLDKIADDGLRSNLAKVGTWSWAFGNLPLAGVRLPAVKLDALRHLDGVTGVYANAPLHYALKDSAKAMNVAHAWNDLHMTGKGITVAILDSGVDGTHPDLAPAMKANVKLLELGAPFPTIPVEGVPNSDTTSGHGTHVAGDVAGRGIKSNGDYRGMAPDANLVGVGAGEGLNIFTAAEGFDWIIANRAKYGIRVVNNSWGGDFAPFDPNAPLNVATKRLADAGVVVLFAMGNSYDELTMNPQAIPPWVIPVAAGTKMGSVTDFTSGGIEADVLGTGFDKVKVDGDGRVAGHGLGLYHPAVTSTGENVISTRANNTVVPLTGAPSDVVDMSPDRIPYYTTLSGTSMATPETAGVVADILQANGALTPGQVRSVLEVTARPIDGVPFYKQGYGYTDASAAVELALSLAGKPASFVQQTLDAKHAARDAVILSDISRPAHTAAWNDDVDLGPVTVDHTMNVPAGTARFKVVANGPSSLELNAVEWDITVTDAKGVSIGATTNLPIPNINSGTAVLDLDLHKLSADPATAAKLFSQLNWGTWTVSVASVDNIGSASLNAVPVVNQYTAKSNLSIVAAAFDAPPVTCLPVPTFVPAPPSTYRLQDDNASGAPYAGDPNYTYVGELPSGNLANRKPARNLVAAFNEFTTEVPFSPPRFSTPALTAPLTIGQAAVVETWVQGPSGTLGAGDLQAAVVDVSPDGSAKTITSTGGTIEVKTDPAAPTQTKAVIPLAKGYTIASGHKLALDLGVLHSQNTVADQLFYDSDQYPTSVTVVPGSIQNISLCGVPGATAATGAAAGGKVLGSRQTRPATATGLPPTGRDSPALLAFGLVLLAIVVRRGTRRRA